MEGDCLNVAQQTHFKVAPTPRVRGAKGISDERCFVFIMYGAKRHNSQSISSCIDLETLREMSSQSGLYNLILRRLRVISRGDVYFLSVVLIP